MAYLPADGFKDAHRPLPLLSDHHCLDQTLSGFSFSKVNWQTKLFFNQTRGTILMFVVIISFPRIKEGKDAEFRKWFASSNQAYANFQGFISRKLLKPLESGNYAAIVEFENRADFKAMHSSSTRDQEAEQVMPMFDGQTTPKFYEVISG